MMEEKLRRFFSDKYNLIVILTFVIIFFIRLYYFIITKTQPVWWDEADYLNIARYWAFGQPDWQVNPLRPLFFPAVLALFLKLGAQEAILRLISLFASVFSIALTYKIGKELYSHKIGIFAAIMFGVFWSFLFFSFRILVDPLVTMLFLLSAYLFWIGYEQGNKKALWLVGPAFALSFLTKFSGTTLIFIFIMFLLLTRFLKFLKNKNLWISVLGGIITTIPFFVFEYLKFGSPLAFYTAAIVERNVQPTFWQNFSPYLNGLLLIKPVFFILFIIGLATSYKLFIGLDLLINGEKTLHADLFLLLWFLIGLFSLGWFGVNPSIGLEERYMFIIYPAMFVFAAKGLGALSDFITKYRKHAAITVILILLAFGSYENLTHADKVIKFKIDSFSSEKQTGTWIRANSDKDALIFSLHSQAELQYSSSREVKGWPGPLDEFNSQVKIQKPKYIVFNPHFQLSDYQINILNYMLSNKNKFPIAATFGQPIDKDGKVPAVIIFEVKL